MSQRAPVAFGQAKAADPDALYEEREDLATAGQAAGIWRTRLSANSRDFEAAWKLAMADYWLGIHGDDAARRRFLENGIDAGRAAQAARPDRVEGYFWMAANMGELAESFGIRQGLKYRRPVKEALEKALALDPSYLGGGPDRALGRWYHKVPGLFGGSNEKSLAHLRRSLTYQPDSTVTHYFLAETLLDMGHASEAWAELQKVIDAPIDPQWAPESREWKGKAATLLKTLNR
jgi:tetratricopeptide (TPR) repeat protein